MLITILGQKSEIDPCSNFSNISSCRESSRNNFGSQRIGHIPLRVQCGALTTSAIKSTGRWSV